MLFEEINQPGQDESIRFNERDKYEAEEKCDEHEDKTNYDDLPNQQYIVDPCRYSFCSVKSLFAFYKEHSRLNEFALLKKTFKKRL